jgi:hypothetical protein
MTESNAGKLFHVRLNAHDREALEYMRSQHGISLTATIRVAIRAAAMQLGFKADNISGDISL